MVLKGTNFDHSKGTFNEAIKVPNYIRVKCRERMIFASAANYLQGRELYECEEDAPAEFHTKTGDFARVLSLISDQLEYEYTLLTFSELHDIVLKGVAKHRALHDEDLSPSNRSRLEKMIQMEELAVKLKIDEKLSENEYGDYGAQAAIETESLLPTNISKRIDLTKQSHYNWDTYWNMISRHNFFNSKTSNNDFDVDDLLSNLFKKD